MVDQIRIIKMREGERYETWCVMINSLAKELKATKIEFNRGTLRCPLVVIHYEV